MINAIFLISFSTLLLMGCTPSDQQSNSGSYNTTSVNNDMQHGNTQRNTLGNVAY